MAKDTKSEPVHNDGLTLAERLFVVTWKPGQGYTPESIAEQCLEAAEVFERVRRERACK